MTEALPHEYMLAKLAMVIPLFEEARDALTALREDQRIRHGISKSLADRMDIAGTFSVEDWRKNFPDRAALEAKGTPDDEAEVLHRRLDEMGVLRFEPETKAIYSLYGRVLRALEAKGAPPIIPSVEPVSAEDADKLRAAWNASGARSDEPWPMREAVAAEIAASKDGVPLPLARRIVDRVYGMLTGTSPSAGIGEPTK